MSEPAVPLVLSRITIATTWVVLAPDLAAQHFHCAVSKVFDRVKSVALWSANIRKLAKDHKDHSSETKINLARLQRSYT